MVLGYAGTWLASGLIIANRQYRNAVKDGSYLSALRKHNEELILKGEEPLSEEDLEILRLEMCAKDGSTWGFWLGLAWPMALVVGACYGIINTVSYLSTRLAKHDIEHQQLLISNRKAELLAKQFEEQRALTWTEQFKEETKDIG